MITNFRIFSILNLQARGYQYTEDYLKNYVKYIKTNT